MSQDNSGTVSMNEYQQLFATKMESSSDEIKAKFSEIDTEPDAKLTKEEFVKWHMTKFAKLEDDNFLIVTGRLLKKAEDEVVIDPPQ